MTHYAMRHIEFPQVLHLNLELHLFSTGRPDDVNQFIIDLVERWLAVDKERHALKSNGPALQGYQWKDLFLPNGTALRTSLGGNTKYARVVGEHVVMDDRRVTPSRFASEGAAPGRNAWRFIWLRFPGDEQWIRASDARRERGMTSKPVVALIEPA
ncbi:MAG: hypothetical protein ACXU8N_10640 [Telluria sp.]